jgi:hypothetical protein
MRQVACGHRDLVLSDRRDVETLCVDNGSDTSGCVPKRRSQISCLQNAMGRIYICTVTPEILGRSLGDIEDLCYKTDAMKKLCVLTIATTPLGVCPNLQPSL